MTEGKSAAEQFLALAAKGKTTRTTLNLDAELHRDFKALCQLKGVTMSDILDVMIRDLLAKFKDDNN